MYLNIENLYHSAPHSIDRNLFKLLKCQKYDLTFKLFPLIKCFSNITMATYLILEAHSTKLKWMYPTLKLVTLKFNWKNALNSNSLTKIQSFNHLKTLLSDIKHNLDSQFKSLHQITTFLPGYSIIAFLRMIADSSLKQMAIIMELWLDRLCFSKWQKSA